MQIETVQLVPISSTTPEELYKSGLTKWGLAEIQIFFNDEKCTYWAYPQDCFYQEKFVILNSLSEIEVE